MNVIDVITNFVASKNGIMLSIFLIIFLFFLILVLNNPNVKPNNYKKYKCDNITFKCKEDPSGTYTNIDSCNNQCCEYGYDTIKNKCNDRPPVKIKKYTCTKDLKCVEDDNGYYTNINDCLNECCPPNQQYDPETKTCILTCPDYQKYDPQTKTCINKCKDDELYVNGNCVKNCNGHPITDREEIIDGKCVEKCPIGQKRCNYGNIHDGTCYDPSSSTCDQVGNICNTTYNFCYTSEFPSGICCPKDQHCDSSVCTDCPTKLCAGNCCSPTQTCINDNCCDKNKVWINPKTQQQECCKNDLCNGICCDTNAGELCIDGKCQIGCPNPNNMSLYNCGDKTPVYDPTKLFWCDPSSNVCLHDCSDDSYKCIPTDKCWNNTIYTPPLLTSNNITYNFDNKGSVSLCMDESNGNWISDNSKQKLSRTVAVQKGSTPLTCTTDSCVNKINQDSSTVINYNPSDLSKPEIKNNICSSTLSCTDSLLSNSDMIKLCGIFDQNGSRDQGRCCLNSDNIYTGQICGELQTCFRSDSQGVSSYMCQDNDKYCKNDAKFDPLKRKCICGIGLAGNICQYTRDNTCHSKGNPKDDGTCQDCDAGYAGTHCELSRDNTCHGKGNPKDDGTCQDCDAGYAGTHCELNRDNTCHGKGNPKDDGTCKDCDTGYVGTNCQFNSHDTCNDQGDPLPNGTCINCKNNFVGSNCQFSRNTTCEGIGNPKPDGSCIMDCEYAITPEECCPFPGGNCDDPDKGTPSHNTHWNCPRGDSVNPNDYKYWQTIPTTVPKGQCTFCFGAVFGACNAVQGQCMRPKVLNNKSTKISGNQCGWTPDNI
jgi:hypothetical protein